MTQSLPPELKLLLEEDPIGTLHTRAREISKQAGVDRQVEVYKTLIDIPRRKLEWERLRRNTSIEIIDVDSFPENRSEPILVLYCADHCLFCYLIKPTFCRIAQFYSDAHIYYSDDERLRRKEGITFTPCLMAYLPDGRRAGVFPGNTTKMLWDMMRLLPALAEHLSELKEEENTCTDGICIIR